MALSGSFYTNVGSYWRLQLEWSATQNISGNYSTVTAKLYWIDRGSQTGISSSASKTASITIAGDSSTNTTTAGLSRNQKKRIHSFTKRVNHNADGSGSFSISAWFDAEVTLGGTTYNRVSLSSRSFTLNKIPRQSSITSSANWTAGNNRSVTISRHSTRFRHNVGWQVKNRSGSWVTVRTYDDIGTSTNGTFTTAQHKHIFELLDGRASADSRVRIETFDGSTKIGSTVYKEGTVTAPRASTTLSNSYTYTIEEGTNIGISRANSNFLHTVVFTFGSFTKTLSNISSPANFTPTSSERTTLYNLTKNSKSIKGSVRITTFYEGVQVRSSTTTPVTLTVTNANPTFSSSQISYADVNTTTTGVTGNNQMIIQGKSTLRVYVDSSATGNKGASISRYTITANGITKSITSTGHIDIGTINSNSNISITVRAVDSRGNSTTVSKSAIVIPYKAPNIISSAKRENNFESNTIVATRGTYSQINVGGTNKNSIKSVQYRYKQTQNSAWSNYYNFTYTTNATNGSYTATNKVIDLDNTQAWDIQIAVTDQLGTAYVTQRVGSGKPLMFIDADKESIGINTFPEDKGSLEVAGNIRAKEQIIVSVGNEGTTNYGLQFEDTGNIISYWSGGITVYGNQSTGNALFRVRGHENHSSYGTDFIIYNTGNAQFYHNLTVDGTTNLRSTGVALNWGTDGRLARNSNGWDYVGRSDIALRFRDDGYLQANTRLDVLGRLTVDGYIELSNSGASGASGGVQLGNGTTAHAITRHNTDNYMVIYPQRYSGQDVFRIRSHHQRGSYRDDLRLDNSGVLYVAGVYSNETTNSTNVRVSSTGQFWRTTSSKKFKIAIEDVKVDPYNILKIKPKDWYDKNNVESYSDILTRQANGEEVNLEEELQDIDEIQRVAGLVADDVADAGLQQYVEYNEKGEIVGLQYDRLWTLLIPIVKDQQEKIEELESKINEINS